MDDWVGLKNDGMEGDEAGEVAQENPAEYIAVQGARFQYLKCYLKRWWEAMKFLGRPKGDAW